jgi:hypothetical protein
MMMLRIFEVFGLVVAILSLVGSISAAEAEVEVETTTGEATATRKKKRRTIDRWELLMVGDESNNDKIVGGKPHGRAISVTPFSGEVYFEANPTKLPGPDGQLFVSVYARVPKGQDCNRGTLLVSSSEEENDIEIETSVSPFDDYRFLYGDTVTTTTEDSSQEGEDATSTTTEFPQTINGRIGAAKFVIGPNPFEMKDDKKQIWFPNLGTNQNGILRVCVRVELRTDFGHGLDTVSYVDTYFTASVDITGKFDDIHVNLSQTSDK